MKKILLIIIISLGLSSCGGKNEYKLKDKITETPTVEIGIPKWKTDITELVPYLKNFDIPEKSEYETKAEYEKKIDSIKNSVEYNEMLTDTFAMVVNDLSIGTGYDAETKTFFFSPYSISCISVQKEEDLCTFNESYANEETVEVTKLVYSFYSFNIKNVFFKQSKNNRLNYVYSFSCKVDLAKKEKEFIYKIYYSLSDFNVKLSQKYGETARSSSISTRRPEYTLNVNIYKIEVILDDNIIFTMTKDNQKEVQSILLPKISYN